MKKILFFIALGLVLLSCPFLFAQIVNEKASFPPVNWVSKNSADTITIQNGTGAAIVIEITVNSTSSSGVRGIVVKNCGATTHIDAGSTGICTTNDPANPVNFNSDSATDPASGTYQIKQL